MANVKSKTTIFEKLLIVATILIFLLLVQSCANTDYQFGDVTRKVDEVSNDYCTTTNPETRAMLKMTLNSMGLSIGIDFCTAYGIKTIALGGGNG